MAEPLKQMYNPQFFERLCLVLKEVITQFDERDFINKVFNRSWPDLELKQRTRQITYALHDILPSDFPVAANKIVAISNLLRRNGERLQSYPYIFLPDYIELYGHRHFEISMRAIMEITKLVSAEFAIRPFLINQQERTLEQLIQWSKQDDAFLRRLSSEGCRPRLPWAISLGAFKRDPSPILPILENLKEDSSEYVRRSVANNLNDIAKDHPQLVLNLVSRWNADVPETGWIIKHGCRTLLKNGNRTALLLNGFDTKKKFLLEELKADKKIRMGDALHFSFSFRSQEKERVRFRLEYGIDYITSTGRFSKKVFKIGEYAVDPGVALFVSRKQSFKDRSTRKHYPGAHQLQVLVNGREISRLTFLVQNLAVK